MMATFLYYPYIHSSPLFLSTMTLQHPVGNSLNLAKTLKDENFNGQRSRKCDFIKPWHYITNSPTMNHLLVLKTLILKLEFETETPHAHTVAL